MPSKNKPYRVIISGGGTGGHIYPAIAIANALKAIDSSTEILFVGAKDRMEMEKVPAAGYKIEGLWISGIQRRLTVDNLLFPVKIISSIWNAGKIISEFKPDIAIGVGGYASWPLLFAANWKKIPTMIQEQNSYAGVTNKLLAKNASKICVAYERMERYFPGDKLELTGNPVRKDILDFESKKQEAFSYFNLQEGKPVILVIGGSLGARTLNNSILAKIDELKASGVQVIWQTGKFYFQKMKEEAGQKNNPDVKVLEFISRMDLAYAAADVVVSRAGALSISELCLVGKPSVLVPSPNVAEDHQTKNAMALVEKNAAIMVKDVEASEKMVPAALDLLKDLNKQKELSQNIKTLGKPDAAVNIAKEVIRIIEAKS
ncbi:MAG: undecaprenyldiphospho-muramoylpentapeptide beta-N-acetylglucosaminyltransferase [Sporocytophaga sp.]|uniref:undecaprenyldiphospho-muramoylpentapeptide beta-N-acetylglucosaminyltransferase n=1 Tax=Sporocytophaga sp. TaxID=2231183 RepID=UPI001AFF1609|nr:undecaprenyldiphospho-muramoylpentapeptide beta-N-acetylglucosaminyltransferase [Sporocytophaga sp.]MBO9700248.1 undecaprenyldiphospho-muramoylpentapeptide beta-N-acetylglucosaminyltransferase [Sporocytophaga sp.]